MGEVVFDSPWNFIGEKMANKNYVKDTNCRVFDTPTKIKQCWQHLLFLGSTQQAFIFTDRKNNFGGKDYYYTVRSENGIYIVSLNKKGEIVRITRF